MSLEIPPTHEKKRTSRGHHHEKVKRKSSSKKDTALCFSLNGEVIKISNPDPSLLTLNYLRDYCNLKGTKYGCGEGGCGACTIMVKHCDDEHYMAINSCLRPLVAMNGMEIITVEGLHGDKDEPNSHPKDDTSKLDPHELNKSKKPAGIDEVAWAISSYNGTQCGFCSPGMVMNVKAHVMANKECELADIEEIFDGNLCRCTGYRPIICAAKTFAKDGNKKELETTPACIVNNVSFAIGLTSPNVHLSSREKLIPHSNAPYDVYDENKLKWYAPYQLSDLDTILKNTQKHSRRYVVGNTSIGIFKYPKETHLIFLGSIKELTVINADKNWIHVGSAASISNLLTFIKSHRTNGRHLESLYNHMCRIAGKQIRNAGSVGGNIILAKEKEFPSDLHIALSTVGAQIVLGGIGAPTDPVNIYSDEFMKSEKLIDKNWYVKEILIPLNSKEEEFFKSIKTAKRLQMSHALINMGLYLLRDTASCAIIEARLFVGGVANQITLFQQTSQELKKHKMDGNWKNLLETIENTLQKEINIIYQPPSARLTNLTQTQLEEKKVLTMQLVKGQFKKLYMSALDQYKILGDDKSATVDTFKNRLESHNVGEQDFTIYSFMSPATEPYIKDSAIYHVTGKTVYTHDVPIPHGCWHGAYILSQRAFAKFKWDDAILKARLQRQFPSVHVMTGNDLKEQCNAAGRGFPGLPGDTIFAHDITIYNGQPIGLALSPFEEEASAAARFLNEHGVEKKIIIYDDLVPILDIHDSIKKGAFLPFKWDARDTDYDTAPDIKVEKSAYNPLQNPDPYSKFIIPQLTHQYTSGTVNDKIWEEKYKKDTDQYWCVEGSISTPAQYHFYMETQSCLVIPQEDHWLVHSSSQSPTSLMQVISNVLDVPTNNILLDIKKLGGSFGGKAVHFKYVAGACAAASKFLNKPVRLVLDRNTDMSFMGKRHPFYNTYRAAMNKKTLQIEFMSLELNSDAGCSYDCSFSVMELAVQSSDNAYYIPNYKIDGRCWFTNKPSSTAFRSFGLIQGMFATESAIEALADRSGIQSDLIRKTNFYRLPNVRTPFGQKLKNITLDQIWDRVKNDVNREEQLQEIKNFNSKNQYRKRGSSLIPLKYGVAFTGSLPLNQDTATILVNMKDGHVIVTTGGVEMGQGLYVKIQQIASQVLGIPMSYVSVSNYSSDKHPHPSSTGASTGTDLKCGATKQAALELRKPIEEFLDKHIDPFYLIDVDRRAQQGNTDAMKEKALLDTWATSRKWYDNWPYLVGYLYKNRVPLIATGFYKVEHINLTAHQYYYFTYAAACTEVEIDTLTGEVDILRVDLIFDAGVSINPSIDIGQVEGGYIQGLGMVTSEECEIGEDGRLLNNGTWEYKIPMVKSIPRLFNVSLYPGGGKTDEKNSHTWKVSHLTDLASLASTDIVIDPAGVQSSKSTGEPPLVLGNSVFYAIRDAIKAANPAGAQTLNVPATTQSVLCACQFSQ